MAFSAGEIEAILRLRDQFSKQLRQAGARAQVFGKNLTNLGNQARQAGTGLTAGLTLPIVALGAAAVVSFARFEKGMNRVAAVTGATGRDFDRLSEKAKFLGATTVFSASQSAEAMGAFGLAGFEVNEILDVMTGTLNLAAAATLDVGTAASITAKVLRGYGIDVSETARVTDVLTKAFTTSNTDLTSLGDAFRSAGPIARSAGIAFEETAAALSLMADAGFQGTLGGTALRGALARLLAPTTQAKDIMKGFGLNVRDASGALLPLNEIIAQLEPNADQTGKIIQLFGLRAGPAMAALINTGSEALREQTQALLDAGGTAETVANIQLKGLAGAFVLFRSAMEGAFIEIGEQLAPALNSLLDILTNTARFIQNRVVPLFAALPKPIQAGAIALVALVAALGPLLTIFGILAASLGSLITLFGTAAFTGALGTAIGFILGPAGLVIALGVLLLSFKPIRDVLVNLTKILIDVAVAGFGFLVKWVKIIFDLWLRWNMAVLRFTGVLRPLLATLRFVGNRVKDVAGAIERTAEATDQWGKTAGDLARDKLDKLDKKIVKFTADLMLAIGKGGVGGLNFAMLQLADVGGLTTDSMNKIALAAIELRDNGTELTAGLESIVTSFERVRDAASQAAEQIDMAAELQRTAEALAELGFVTSDEVNEALDDLAAKQQLAIDVGIPLVEIAVALRGEFDELAESARKSGLKIERLAEEVQKNKIAMFDAMPVAQNFGFIMGLATVPLVGLTEEQERAATQARLTAEAFKNQGVVTQEALRATRVQAQMDFALISASAGETSIQAAAAFKRLEIARRLELGLTAREMQRTAGVGTQAFATMVTAIEGSFAQMLIGSKNFSDGFIDIWQAIKRTVTNIFGSIVSLFLRNVLGRMLGGMRSAQPSFARGFAGLFGAGGGGGGPGGGGFSLASLFGGGGGPQAVSAAAGGVGPPAPAAAAAASPIAGLALSGVGGLAAGELGRQLFGPGKGAAAFGAAAGAAQGALIGSVVPGIGTAVGAAVGGVAGFFRGLAGPNEAERTATRDAVDQFTGIVKAGLTDAQRNEAASAGTSGIRIAIRDAYGLLGLGGHKKVTQDLFNAIRSGQTERTVKQMDPILKVLKQARRRRDVLDLFSLTGGTAPLLQARHGISGDFGRGTAVMLHGEETVTPGRDGGGPSITINITALDPNGLRKVVEEEVIPMIADATRGNRLQARTRLRNGLGVT